MISIVKTVKDTYKPDDEVLLDITIVNLDEESIMVACPCDDYRPWIFSVIDPLNNVYTMESNPNVLLKRWYNYLIIKGTEHLTINLNNLLKRPLTGGVYTIKGKYSLPSKLSNSEFTVKFTVVS